MARMAKRCFLALAAYAAAVGALAPACLGAERLALAGRSAAAQPTAPRVALAIARDAASKFPARLDPGFHRTPPGLELKGRSGKALRIDLFRLEVSRQFAPDFRDRSEVDFPAGVLFVTARAGAGGGATAVGIEVPLAPHTAVESRLSPEGEGDARIRFRLRY